MHINITCPLCFNQALSFNAFNLVYYNCKNCDLIFKDKQHHLIPHEEYDRYTQHENTIENRGYVKMFERFLKNIELPEYGLALDYGCGPGPVLATLLQRRGLDVDVYDPYFQPKPIFQNKCYDLITCTEVLEHVKEPSFAFSFFVKHLTTGGKLAVMTRFHPGVKRFSSWWYRRDETHITFYNMKTFNILKDIYSLNILYTNRTDTIVFSL